MWDELNETSLAYIILKDWMPPVISVAIGGLFASVLFPRWQDRHARYHAREARRLALAEELAQNLGRYIAAWNRLRAIAELEASRPGGLTEAEFERKKGFVQARGAARDALMDTFCGVEIYFSGDVRAAIEEFSHWDEANATRRLDELPARSEYSDRRKEILACVHREVAR